MSNISAEYIKSIQHQFNYYKSLGDQTIDSLSDEEFYWTYNAEGNDIATIINHMVGNMLSRWTNFYTEDGEKEWRLRDNEFLPVQKSNRSPCKQLGNAQILFPNRGAKRLLFVDMFYLDLP